MGFRYGMPRFDRLAGKEDVQQGSSATQHDVIRVHFASSKPDHSRVLPWTRARNAYDRHGIDRVHPCARQRHRLAGAPHAAASAIALLAVDRNQLCGGAMPCPTVAARRSGAVGLLNLLGNAGVRGFSH